MTDLSAEDLGDELVDGDIDAELGEEDPDGDY
jgi:hypothetical protein